MDIRTGLNKNSEHNTDIICVFIDVLSKTKVKLGRLEVSFNKNLSGKKNNC